MWESTKKAINWALITIKIWLFTGSENKFQISFFVLTNFSRIQTTTNQSYLVNLYFFFGAATTPLLLAGHKT